MIQKLYPEGCAKAFSLSYDDGVQQDIRLVALLNRYGLKGTFNLNSGLMLEGFTWHHESGLEIRRLTPEVAATLYKGHEVACHTFSHPYLENLSHLEILKELYADKYFLEHLIGEPIVGFATPFTHYSETVASLVRQCGFSYARISEESGNYRAPEDPYYWRGGKFHWDDDLEEYVNGFLQSDEELALCQIVGHSYDLDVMDSWDRMEALFRKICIQADVLPMTNRDIITYHQAMAMAEITSDYIRNNSKLPLWFRENEQIIVIQPGEMFQRKE